MQCVSVCEELSNWNLSMLYTCTIEVLFGTNPKSASFPFSINLGFTAAPNGTDASLRRIFCAQEYLRARMAMSNFPQNS